MTFVILIPSFSDEVFGFFQDTFIGVEQGQAHMVQTGYQKGAAKARVNLVFKVVDTPGTASETCFV